MFYILIQNTLPVQMKYSTKSYEKKLRIIDCMRGLSGVAGYDFFSSSFVSDFKR